MSSTFLKLIPISPYFIPTKANQDNAEAYLKTIFKKAEIELIQTEDVEFVDQGANFEDVQCNYCGSKLDIEVWQNAMDEAFESKFIELDFITSCCKKMTSLNDLKYNWSAGFAKFAILILNPEKEIGAEQTEVIEELLNTKVRTIWAHY